MITGLIITLSVVAYLAAAFALAAVGKARDWGFPFPDRCDSAFAQGLCLLVCILILPYALAGFPLIALGWSLGHVMKRISP